MNLKNLIGKKVYSIYEGEIVGTVVDVTFKYDFKKIHSLTIFNDDEEEFSLPIASIYAMGDSIIIKNKTKLTSFVPGRNLSTISKDVFNNTATHLGKIVDLEFDQFGNIVKFVTNKEIFLNPNNISNRKNFVLFFDDKIKIAGLKPRNKKQNYSKIKVNIFNIDDAKTTNFLPSKLQYNPQSILGKIAKGDLVGLNNEIIIKTNQTITEKTIQDATRHNRLNQLYYLAN